MSPFGRKPVSMVSGAQSGAGGGSVVPVAGAPGHAPIVGGAVGATPGVGAGPRNSTRTAPGTRASAAAMRPRSASRAAVPRMIPSVTRHVGAVGATRLAERGRGVATEKVVVGAREGKIGPREDGEG